MYKIAASENRLAQGLLRAVGAFLRYVHFEIDTLDTITLLENGGYLVIVSSVLRVKCYGVQSMGYRVMVSIVL